MRDSFPAKSGDKIFISSFDRRTKRKKRRLAMIGVPRLSFRALSGEEGSESGFENKQQHPTYIKHRDFVSLQVDLAQRGLGDNIWGTLPHEPYRLLGGKYSYSYVIIE